MPLLWLLVIVVLPSVRATAECHTACDLCVIDKNPATAACKLCRECHKVHLRMMGPNKQMLSHQQNRQLKELEKREFKLDMKEYRWMPQDLDDSDNRLERLDDDVGDEDETDAEPDQEVRPEEATPEEATPEEATPEQATPEEAKPEEAKTGEAEAAADCVPFTECINNDDNDEKPEKRKLGRTTKTLCPTLPTPRNCPRIQPCKKALVKKRKLHKSAATQSTAPIMILKHIVTLDYKADKERPTQPDWPEPDSDYDSPPTKPCPVKLLKKTTRKPTTTPPRPCVPCMPMCPLPCGLVTQNPPFQPLIPQVALEALMTLKPTTTKLDNRVTESDSSAVSDEEKFDKMVQEKRKYEDTTKDYVYLYVGIPKDGNHARYG